MNRASLSVIYQSEIVGNIYINEVGHFCFEYEGQWLKNKNAFPISHSLPLSKQIFLASAQSFFSNLLPEGQVRKIIASRLGLSEQNDYSMLKYLGEDCAGAFMIMPKMTPLNVSIQESYKPIKLSEIVKIYNEQPAFYLGIASENVRLSLAGAQDKVPLLFSQNNFFVPENGAPSSHILKLPSKNYAYLSENEYLITKIAKDCGLNVMPSQLIYYEQFCALLVERYDRKITDNKIQRLHQEDFCQALGISHANKYEEEGGPSLVKSFDLIQSESFNVIDDIEQFLKWTFFNICIGNCDNHGKNLSLLMSLPNHWSLSPFYDLVCTKAYKALSKKQAMSIGGSFDGANLSARNWNQLMKEFNYSYKKFVNDICLPLVDTIQISLEEHVSFFKDKSSYNFIRVLSKDVKNLTQRAEKSLLQ
jgi:serine/threonine-protein kinase HipA